MAYLTAAELQDRRPSLAYQDTADLDDLCAQFALIVEGYVGRSYAVGTVTMTRWVEGGVGSVAAAGPVASITAATLDGVAVVATMRTSGSVIYFDPAVGGTGVLSVVYSVSGGAPADLLEACAEYVERSIVSRESGTSRDILGQSIDGSYVRYSSPDIKAGRPTGWSDVDRLLNTLRARDYVPGIA